MKYRYKITESYTVPPKNDDATSVYWVLATNIAEATEIVSQRLTCDKVTIELD